MGGAFRSVFFLLELPELWKPNPGGGSWAEVGQADLLGLLVEGDFAVGTPAKSKADRLSSWQTEAKLVGLVVSN